MGSSTWVAGSNAPTTAALLATHWPMPSARARARLWADAFTDARVVDCRLRKLKVLTTARLTTTRTATVATKRLLMDR